MNILIDVKGQRYTFGLGPESASPIGASSDTINYIKCIFTFDSEWDGLTKQVNFMNFTQRKVYTVNLEDDECYVPYETMTREGTISMSITGFVGTTTLRITTFKQNILDIDKALPSGEGSTITPTQFEQFVSLCQSYKTGAESARDLAQTYATSASSSATSASASATSAEEDAQTATLKASAAATSASAALTSQNSAASSATSASSSATSASNSATSASNSATSASNSASSASASATSAATYEAKIENMTVSSQTGTTISVEKQELSDHFNLLFTLKQGDKGDKGDTGATGNGIASTVLNADYTLTITFTDGTSYTTTSIRGLQGAKGDKGDTGDTGDTGNGIQSTVLNADYTLTITFTDGTSYTTPSIRGSQGEKGNTGDTGATGNGIASIAKTSTVGKTDTYTVTYTDGSTFTYTVKNGDDGTGSGDMLTSVYDPEGGVRQVAFKDSVINRISAGTGIVTSTSSGQALIGLSSESVASLAKADTALQEHQDISGKQDVISDLSTIRSGASAGATAYQKPASGIPKTDLASAVQTSLGLADTALQSHQDISGKADVSTVNAIDTRVTTIEGKIPNQATSSNQLGDKDFINSSINSVTAFYITKNANGDQFNTKAELDAATTFYSGGEVRVPTRNDYCIVLVDETKSSATTRYIYQNGWEYQYTVNETALTAAQLAAINSNITASLVTSYSNHIANTDIHVTTANKTAWSAKYDKPSTGIPKTDLASAVQTSLGLADSAVQDVWDEMSPTISKTSASDGITFGATASVSGIVASSGWDIKIEDSTLQASLVAVFGNDIIA